jgi:hypothetical protein
MNISQINTKKRPAPKESPYASLEFPIGAQAHFQFQTDQFIFLEIEDNLNHIIHTDPKKLLNRSIFYLVDSLCINNHIQSTHALLQKGMEFIKDKQNKSLSINLEFNIKEEDTGSKRILLQLRNDSPFQGQLNIGIGKLTDINHIIRTGPPVLTIIKENKILKRISYSHDDITTANGYNLSARELEVLKLKSEGYSTKKIADTLHLTTLSIYSIIRDIKSKTGIPPLSLIKELATQGKI